LTKTHKYDDLEEYIDQIYEDVEIANELVITGNKTLSVLINSKKSLATGMTAKCIPPSRCWA
jgi:hypothetical protein